MSVALGPGVAPTSVMTGPDGIIYFLDHLGAIIFQVDGNTRTVTFPSGAILTLSNVPSLAAGLNILNNQIFSLGTGGDVALVERTAILGANTALTGVLVGVPVTPQVEADSFILSNVTADGDIMLVTQSGGNSYACFWYDASAKIGRLYSGSGVEILQLAAALMTVTGRIAVVSANAAAFAVGRQGATNPAFNVDASTATQLTGLGVTGKGTGAGVSVAAIEAGGTNNALGIDAMGSGVINIGSISTGLVTLARGANKGPVYSLLKTDINTQNAAPTAAQFLGGYITHNSQTGAGTLTTPTGANISAAIAGVAVGDAFNCFYQNRGNQTVTLTAGDGNVTLKGTLAVATLKESLLLFVNTGANTWDCLQILGG